jgi:hypothetical protein
MDYFAGERVGRSARPLALVTALLLVAGLIGALTVRPRSHAAAIHDGNTATVLRTAASAATSTPMQIDSIITIKGARTISVHMTGQVDRTRGLGRTTFDPDAGLFTEPIQMLEFGTDAYIQVPESRRAITQNKPWARLDAAAIQTSGLSSDDDVIQRLATMEADGTTARVVGHETVNGAATTKYELSIDPAKAAAALPAGFRLPAGVANLPPATVDVWIDGARRPRRIIQDFSLGTAGSRTTVNYYPLPGPLVLDRPADPDTMTLTDPINQLRAILPPLQRWVTSG